LALNGVDVVIVEQLDHLASNQSVRRCDIIRAALSA